MDYTDWGENIMNFYEIMQPIVKSGSVRPRRLPANLPSKYLVYITARPMTPVLTLSCQRPGECYQSSPEVRLPRVRSCCQVMWGGRVVRTGWRATVLKLLTWTAAEVSEIAYVCEVEGKKIHGSTISTSINIFQTIVFISSQLILLPLLKTRCTRLFTLCNKHLGPL